MADITCDRGQQTASQFIVTGQTSVTTECPLVNNVVCFFLLWGETEFIGTAATSGPTVPVPVLCMNMEQGWNAYRQGKIEALGEIPNRDDHGIDPGPLQREE